MAPTAPDTPDHRTPSPERPERSPGPREQSPPENERGSPSEDREDAQDDPGAAANPDPAEPEDARRRPGPPPPSPGHRPGYALPWGAGSAVGPSAARNTWEGTAMARNVAQKLIASHLVEGDLTPGSEVGLRVDQTLTQDATGTMV